MVRTTTRDVDSTEVKVKLNMHCELFAAARALEAYPELAADAAYLYQRAYQEQAKFYFWLLPEGLPCD